MSEQQNHENKPQFSVLNEKNELKKMETNVDTMKNRIQLLKQQLQKEKESIKKNKTKTKQVIEKKIQINKFNRYKQKDTTEEQKKIEELRLKNQSMRISHNKELEDIQKAIYLVKLDDAREAKNISNQHKKKLQEMERDFLSAQKQKKQKVADESAKAKQRYIRYMKQKLTAIYTEQAQTIANINETKDKKKVQLAQLEEEEIKLMEQINRYHTKQVQTKKQYLAALSLPVKEVAEAMGDNESPEKKERKEQKRNRSSYDLKQSRLSSSIQKGGLRLPNTNLNQAKLKVILKQLKSMDRSKGANSARYN